MPNEGLIELCQQIVGIDPNCPSGKDCPAQKAWDITRAWMDANGFKKPKAAPKVIFGIMHADGKGRVCEIGEIQLFAQGFLENPTPT